MIAHHLLHAACRRSEGVSSSLLTGCWPSAGCSASTDDPFMLLQKRNSFLQT